MRLFHLLTNLMEAFLIVLIIVATEVVERSALTESCEANLRVGRCEYDIPHLACGVNAARSASGLLKDEFAWEYFKFEREKMHEEKWANTSIY